MDILIATSNPGKFREISKFLSDPRIKLFSLKNFEKVNPPLEDGATFKENAKIKAEYYARKFNIPAIADDGGLEIDVLNGEPGIKSRRWIDGINESTDEELIQFCLKQLKGQKDRKAKLTVCLCLVVETNIFFAKKSIPGIITKAPSKIVEPGYPFRSIFWVPELKKFYHEDKLTEEETKQYNHRYKAVKKLKREIEKYL